MQKILGFLMVFFVGLGFGYLVFHHSAVVVSTENKAGAQVQNDTFNFTGGFNAGASNQFGVSSTGALSSTAGITAATFGSATIGTSSATPAALGSAATGFFTATTTSQLASTTAVTANSIISIEPSSTSPFSTLSVPCNAVAPSTTLVTQIWPGNGFKVTVSPAPSGSITPYCLAYTITN